MAKKLTYTEVTYLRSSLRNDLAKQMPLFTTLAYNISPQRIKNNPAFKNDGSRKDYRIIKNQAGRSLRTFVAGMCNGATPRARPWFNLTVNSTAKAKTLSVKKYFSAVEGILNSHFQVSNLYRVLPLAYKDLGIFSNAAYAMLPHARYGFYFYPFAIGTYAFSTDAEGNTNMFTRDFSLSVKEVVTQYAQKDVADNIIWDNIPPYVKQCWDSARYLEVVLLTLLIVPNPEYVPGKVSFDSADKKFQSYTYVQSMGGSNIPPQSSSGFRDEITSTNKSPFLRVSGFNYFPVITPRWEVAPEEDYGVDGPGMLALSDIMTLQEMERYRLEGIAKLVKPPMVGPSSLRRHQASILAGGITYVDDQGSAVGFKPAFEMDPRLSELVQAESDYTQAIRSAFFEDLFLMFGGEETVSHVTATEINEKSSERMAALAPVLGQVDQDQNSKIIENGQIILEEQGRLPAKPQELQGEQIRPEYISILAQASKVSMMNSMERFANFVGSMAQSQNNPSLLKIFNAEMAIREYGSYVAIDPILMRDEQEFQKIVVQDQKAQAQQQQAAMQQQQAATAKDLAASPIGQGSLLDTALNAASA